MRLTSFEHGKLAYRADFALYGTAVLLLGTALLAVGPRAHWLELVAFGAAGLAGWSAIEYGLHRFVLHGLEPFRRWHALHHDRPTALICTPTVLTATLFALLVFLPALALSDLWSASSLTLGLLIGYQGYAITHHALHHWRGDNAWLRRLKRSHARHHHGAQPCCYGVTTTFWDRVFGSLPATATEPGHPQACNGANASLFPPDAPSAQRPESSADAA